MNQFDGDFISSILLEKGYEKSEIPDIYIINTCTVTHQADRSSRQAIYKAKRENPNAVLIATGCYAQTNKEALERLKEVDIIIGNSDKESIVNAVEKFLKNKEKRSYVENIFRKNDLSFKENIVVENQRPFLKIQEGCNSFCSFCVIPFARGKVRSVHINDIIKSVKNLYERGYKEVILTGTQLSQYGEDIGLSLYGLLKELIKIPILIRLSSMNINELKKDKNILDLITQEQNIAPHFHLSLQSGSERILKLMEREYTLKEYEDICCYILRKRPITAIGTDIIVGFPTESNEDFEYTYNFIKNFDFAYLHIFSYSDRPFTKSSNIYPKVPPNIIKERSKILHNLDEKKRKTFKDKMRDKTLRAITISHEKAITENYIEIQGNFDKINDIILIGVNELQTI